MNPSTPLSESDDVLLEALGIAKSFPGVRALDDVSITVRRGRLNALLGENGAGKSTLMNILAGVFPPDAGQVMLQGQAGQRSRTRATRRRPASRSSFRSSTSCPT